MNPAGDAGANVWRPSADSRARFLRAAVNRAIRDFFAERGVLEVETPFLSQSANPDPSVAPIMAGGSRYLRTSPEFPLKRLLCADNTPVYELGRVFRDGEAGRRHHREFSMLEWYRPGFSMAQLMDEVVALIQQALAVTAKPPLSVQQLGYYSLLEQFMGEELPSSLTALRRCCSAKAGMGEESASQMDWDQCLDLLFSAAGDALPAEQITLISHFPASQAALAKIDPANPELALRFEVFAGGMELANGYDELLDADELRERFIRDNDKRRESGETLVAVDDALLAAQRAGMPDCCGVSVGVDRLLMLVGGYSQIHDVINFPEVKV
ncbi:MAG: EF-P lysine aminoacylase EpmA [Lysobacterales bacterium]